MKLSSFLQYFHVNVVKQYVLIISRASDSLEEEELDQIIKRALESSDSED